MKNSRLFRFYFDRNAIIGIVSGLIMIFLSVSMNFFPQNAFMQFVLRDVLMIFFVGFVFPLCFIVIRCGENLSVLGIHNKKWKRSLLMNILFAIALLAMFIKESSDPVVFNKQSFFAVSYIFAAGIFEMVFIYGFLRYTFERAFGIIPAVILTAAFYSLHHAGFQPEFLKLFWVGLMYVSVFYITRNLLIIFPFFWGVGAVWDVLVNSAAGRQIENAESFVIAIILLICMVIAGVIIFLFTRKKDGCIISHKKMGGF